MRWTGACIAVGLCAARPIELENGRWCDVEDPRVRATILEWIRKGLVWFVHLATPCTKHSRARSQGEKKSTRLTTAERFTAEVLRAIRLHGGLFCLENHITLVCSISRVLPVRWPHCMRFQLSTIVAHGARPIGSGASSAPMSLN